MPAHQSMFDSMAQSEGWEILSSGWPDRLLIRRSITNGGVATAIFVELKGAHYSKLSPGQVTMLRTLEQLGLQVRVWCGGGVNDVVSLQAYLSGEASEKYGNYTQQEIYNMRTEVRKIFGNLYINPGLPNAKELRERAVWINAKLPEGMRVSEAEITTEVASKKYSPEATKKKAEAVLAATKAKYGEDALGGPTDDGKSNVEGADESKAPTGDNILPGKR